MNVPTIPELLRYASEHPFLREHLAAGTGARSGEVVAHAGELELCSAYEPIYEVGAPQRIAQAMSAEPDSAERFGDEIGFSAVTVLPDGTPAQPFGDRLGDPELVDVDRMVRALHTINFLGARQHGLLFLRVHERLLKSVKYDHGRVFSSVLTSFGLNPARIVIELPAAAVAHRTFVGYLTRSYQRHGFKVAGNLPNAGQILSVSDMARPDFVKMDARAALRDSVVKPLVGYASRLRLPLIFDRVENAAQFDMLMQYDVRFVQGPLFAPQSKAA